MYGGGLWHTWYDRVLGLGGRVIVKTKEGKLQNRVYSCKKPLAKISTLAVHLKNTATELKIRKETDLKPIIATELLQSLNCGKDGECSGLLEFLASELDLENASQIVDFDLCFGEFDKPQIFGLYYEFLSSPRLDN